MTPTALFDTHNILLDIRDATWVNIRIVDTRTALNKSYVKYDEIVHYKNGTEGSSTSEIELGTTHGFPIIMANLNVDDNWFHDESEEYPTTKEIITITYPDGRREVNHIFVYLTSRILDMFFDRSTGMPIKLTFNDPTGVATIELSDSSSWVVPEFPSFIVVSFLMAAVLAGAIIYKKKPKTRK